MRQGLTALLLTVVVPACCACARARPLDRPVTDADAAGALRVADEAAAPERLAPITGRDTRGAQGARALEVAISHGRVEATRLLLEAGVDPNGAESQGRSVSRWLGSGPGVADDDVLAVAKLLDAHGCRFDQGVPSSAPDLVTNLAPRGLPKTLGFLVSKHVAADYTQALEAVARRDDVESTRVLLAAGADPIGGPELRSALMDAASRGSTASVAAMLSHVGDKQALKVLAAYRSAVRTRHQATAQAFLDAGVKPPVEPAPFRNPCDARPLTADQSALLARLVPGFSDTARCTSLKQCGTMTLIDCNSAADGPAFYIEEATSALLATCGGACMGGRCTDCPPAGWQCDCAR